MTTTTYQVTGMTCDHCVRAVTTELIMLPGVRSVDVDLGEGLIVGEAELFDVVFGDKEAPSSAVVVAQEGLTLVCGEVRGGASCRTFSFASSPCSCRWLSSSCRAGGRPQKAQCHPMVRQFEMLLFPILIRVQTPQKQFLRAFPFQFHTFPVR